MRGAALALLISSAGPALAEDFSLALPIDCTLGQDCYIQQYMDRDPGEGATDYRCSTLSYDGHKGTDFALPTRRAMEAGVDVLAAADGRVRGFRDGMPDSGWSEETAAAVEGKECGNGVVLVHPGGWETQYCHMRQGSVIVSNGASVKAGEVIGQVGQSGRAEFPHVHLSVRRNGAPVDPFDPDGTLICGNPPEDTLWQEVPAYQPGGIIEVGIGTEVPAYAAVKAGLTQSDRLPDDATALVVHAFTFGTRTDDVLRLTIRGPEGEVLRRDTRLERNHAQAYRAVGQRLRAWRRWPEGDYTGEAELLRGGETISRREITVRVGP